MESAAGALTSYTHDGENRMLKMINSSNQVTTNSYSGDGPRRTWQTLGGAVHDCKINGVPVRDPGDLDGDAIAVVTVRIVLP